MKNTLFFKHLNSLTNTEIAYVAGIVDGEGHISIQDLSLRVSITNTNKALMNWLSKILDKRLYHYKPKNKLHQERWTITLCAYEGSLLLKKIYPYMIAKRPQVEEVLRCTWDQDYRANQMPDIERERRYEAGRKIQEMNRGWKIRDEHITKEMKALIRTIRKENNR